LAWQKPGKMRHVPLPGAVAPSLTWTVSSHFPRCHCADRVTVPTLKIFGAVTSYPFGKDGFLAKTLYGTYAKSPNIQNETVCRVLTDLTAFLDGGAGAQESRMMKGLFGSLSALVAGAGLALAQAPDAAAPAGCSPAACEPAPTIMLRPAPPPEDER